MSIKGKSAYNNGSKLIYLGPDEIIPEGFVKGGLASRTPEEYKRDGKKSSDTQKPLGKIKHQKKNSNG